MLIVTRAGPSRVSALAKRSYAVVRYAEKPSQSSRGNSVQKNSLDQHPARPPPPTPYDLSQRMIDVASRGEIDRAIDIVKHSALDSQSTTVWNTLLKQILLAERFKLSYEIFTDVSKFFVVNCDPLMFIL